MIDNFATARRDNLGEHERLTLVEGTIVDPELVDEDVRGLRARRRRARRGRLQGPGRLDARTRPRTRPARRTSSRRREAAGVERLVYFQTALCYGLHPLEQPITLDHPLRPEDSSYAISKTAGEHYVALSGLDWVSLRLANAYGPRNVSGPLPTFFQRLTEGKPCFVMDTRRDFIYVAGPDRPGRRRRSTAKGSGGAYHASSGSDYSIKELFDATVARARARARARGRGARPEPGRRVHDPARPEPHAGGVRLEAEDAARGGRRGARSTTTATTGSRRRTRT